MTCPHGCHDCHPCAECAYDEGERHGQKEATAEVYGKVIGYLEYVCNPMPGEPPICSCGESVLHDLIAHFEVWKRSDLAEFEEEKPEVEEVGDGLDAFRRMIADED